MKSALAAGMLSVIVVPYLGYAGREPAARVARRVAPAATAPNVVVFMSDDLSLSTLNAGLANGWMPNLQTHIVSQGTTFANSFVADSVCCPSRATFLTGQQSHNHGVTNNQYPGGGVTFLDDASTLATWLRAAGYRTGLVGKYLNGYGQDLSPSPVDDPTYVPPGWDDWQAILTGAVYNYEINDNGTLIGYGSQPSDYLTDVLAARAVDFVRESDGQNDAQPFFLWVTTTAPHALGGAPLCAMNYGSMAPYTPAARHVGIANNLPLPQPASFNEANVADKPAWLKSNYPPLKPGQVNCLRTVHRKRVETMMAVDDLIGSVVLELQATGELADTLLVFTSDNGFLLGEHRVAKKHQAFEEAIRVPLYVSGPGVAAQQAATQMVVNTDLAPTILELAQATAGLPGDGRSLVPILADPTFTPWRTYFLVEHTQVIDSPVTEYAAVRSGQHLWVEYTDGQRELYDLWSDPSQLTSQHAKSAYDGVKVTLGQKLQALRSCAGSGCWQ